MKIIESVKNFILTCPCLAKLAAVNVDFLPESTDTYSNTVINMVFDTLIDMDENSEFIPGLAESWEISDDYLTITFKIREGVKFHDGSDLDADTKSRLALGERIVSVLKQKNNAPVEVAHQVCIIYAVTNGYLNPIDVNDIPEFERRLYEYLDVRYEDMLNTIRTTGKLEKDTEETLKTAITELLTEFGKSV